MFDRICLKVVGAWCILISIIAAQNDDTIICIRDYSCVPLSKCQDDGNIRYTCDEHRPRVCCPPELIVDSPHLIHPILPSDRIANSKLPTQCGIVTSTDRITGGQSATLGQFPWMALLGYKQIGLDIAQFLCGGSIITKSFVLTAAHCVNIDNRLKLSVVRLGELNIETEIDCENEGDEKVCADKYLDLMVDVAIVHEKYDTRTLENDIALVRLKDGVESFTDYIQPICLPVANDPKYKTTPNYKLTVSGWGKTSSANVAGSFRLQFAEIRLWSYEQCNSSVPIKIRPIRNSQLCANGERQQDACKGDSGGPLTNTTVIDGDIRSYQVGIVSFASAQVCGNGELPSIYTKVEYYVDWIVSNIT